jgi:hypothetical protein
VYSVKPQYIALLLEKIHAGPALCMEEGFGKEVVSQRMGTHLNLTHSLSEAFQSVDLRVSCPAPLAALL